MLLGAPGTQPSPYWGGLPRVRCLGTFTLPTSVPSTGVWVVATFAAWLQFICVITIFLSLQGQSDNCFNKSAWDPPTPPPTAPILPTPPPGAGWARSSRHGWPRQGQLWEGLALPG